MTAIDTIIIGGGIAGLACARRLHECGRDFRLLTDRLGGRMFAGPEPTANFGACYITADYRHVSRFVDRGPAVRFGDVFFPDRDRSITLYHPRNLRRLGPIARLYRRLIPFRAALNRLRRAAPFACQAELLRGEPLLARAVAEPAGEFIHANRLEEIDEVFTNPLVYSTLFVSSREVNTFYYLAALMPILVRTYLADFTHTLARLTAGFEDRIERQRVVALEEESDGWLRVTAEGQQWRARHVVVATPGHNTRRFCSWLPDAAGTRAVPMATLHVHGRRRPAYRPGKLVFLGPGASATVLLPARGGDCDILFSRTCDPDLSAYYETHQVVRRLAWKTALVLSGAVWRPLAPAPNLFTIGDHNISGLEDSYLTGLFAANAIVHPGARVRALAPTPRWSWTRAPGNAREQLQ